jgi:para-nitrobenzyl esterase
MTEAAYAKGADAMAKESGVPAADLTGKYYPLANYGSDPALRPALAAAAAGTDSTFSCNGVNVSARIARQDGQIWMYEFRDKTAPSILSTIGGKYMLSTPTGPAHASEVPYVFKMLDLGGGERQALSDTMAAYWTNFAKTGNPNGAGVPTWPGFQSDRLQALDVAAAGGVAPMPASAFRSEHQCETAWAKETF